MSIDGGIDKDVHIYNGILLSYKKRAQDPIIQSEVSQKEK